MSEKRQNKIKMIKIYARFGGIMLLGIFVVLACVSYFNRSFGWFTKSVDVTGNNMNVSMNAAPPFELAFKEPPAEDSPAIPNAAPYADSSDVMVKLDEGGYHRENEEGEHVTTNSSSGLAFLLIDEKEEHTDGALSPGSHGIMKFYIIPKSEDIRSVNLTFNINCLSEIEDTQSTPPATSLEWIDTETDVYGYLRGHLLLFKNRSEETGLYSDRLTGGETYSYVFADHEADKTVSDGVVRYEVNVYWIWPKTFSQLAYSGNTSYLRTQPIFAAGSAELTEMIEEMTLDPDSFFKYVGEETPDNYAELMQNPNEYYNFVALSVGYDNADQYLGESADFLVVEIDASVGNAS